MTLATFVLESLGSHVVGDSVRLDGREGHHAAVVRRVTVGEHVTLTDGAGTMAACSVVAIDKRGLDATVLHIGRHRQGQPRLTVVQAVPKGERGELAVEMLTEVGADVIVPWAAHRTVAKWRGERAEKGLTRWRVTAREAAKQAHRPWFPEVADLATTTDVADRLRAASLSVVLHEEAGRPLADVDLPAVGEVVVVVGPEGGIAPDELEAFAEAGAQTLRMGPTVLRTSTAGAAAAAALLARTDRWR